MERPRNQPYHGDHGGDVPDPVRLIDRGRLGGPADMIFDGGWGVCGSADALDRAGDGSPPRRSAPAAGILPLLPILDPHPPPPSPNGIKCDVGRRRHASEYSLGHKIGPTYEY